MMSIVVEELTQSVHRPQEDEAAMKLRPRRPPELAEIAEKLKAETVQGRLREEAPAWRLINGATAINRTREFPEVRAAMAYVSYVSVLASSLGLSVSVLLSGRRAVLTLQGSRKGKHRGVTDSMVDFAAALG
jgi:pterin-4a-carbinolamine dehydratase